MTTIGSSQFTFTFKATVHPWVFVFSLLVQRTHRHGVVFHCVLVADSGFVVHNGQAFEAVPTPEHSELIILTSYGK